MKPSKLPDDLEQKRQQAIAWLRSRGKYLLDKGTPPPKWSANQRGKK